MVVVSAVQAATHAEVRDLDRVVRTNETVSRREVAVHDVERFEVLHAGRNLASHVDEAAVTTIRPVHCG